VGAYFPVNLVIHRSDPQKALPFVESRRLSHEAVGSGHITEKRKTGQSKKSQSGNISPILGEAPTTLIETKICIVDTIANIITYAKF